jgi:hypothetical protein
MLGKEKGVIPNKYAEMTGINCSRPTRVVSKAQPVLKEARILIASRS